MKGIIILVGIVSVLGIGFYFVTTSGSLIENPKKSNENISTDSILGVFEGKVPCPDCQLIKVRLTLYVKETNSAGYLLERVYVGKGNDVTKTTGSWTITQGIKVNSNALVYMLDSNSPMEFRSYYAVDNNLLLILDDNGELKVGDAAHSFTLSKTR
jgi:hypothetical protein